MKLTPHIVPGTARVDFKCDGKTIFTVNPHDPLISSNELGLVIRAVDDENRNLAVRPWSANTIRVVQA